MDDVRLTCYFIAPATLAPDETLEAIRRALQKRQIQLISVNDLPAGSFVTESVTSLIRQTDFIIADISDRNSNVFYELGLAHGMRKPVLLIARQNELGNIPFDLASSLIISYSNSGELEDFLERWLTRHADDLRQISV
jgi:nucleoside 2-deoxyribosyltransferase